jgi:hypothetical protein
VKVKPTKEGFKKYEKRISDKLPSKMELMAVACEMAELLGEVGRLAINNEISTYPHGRAIALCGVVTEISNDCDDIMDDFRQEFGEIDDEDLSDIIPFKNVTGKVNKVVKDISILNNLDIDDISGDS